jgi:hypothetical protein
MTSEHQKAEEEIRLEKETLVRAMDDLQKELSEAEKSLENVVSQVQSYKNEISEYEKQVATNNQLEKELENVRAALLDKATLQLSQLQESLRKAEELKMSNDVEEERLVIPAREECKALDIKRENLAQLTAQISIDMMMQEEENKKCDDEDRALLEQLNKEYENNQDIIASRKAEQTSVQRLIEDENETFERDEEAQLALIANVKASIKECEQSIYEAEEARKAAKLKRQIEERSKYEKRLEIEKMKLEMYERASKIIMDTDEQIKGMVQTMDNKLVKDSGCLSNKRPREQIDE